MWFSWTPYWGPGLQSRHVLWLGIKPVTLWFAEQHSTHWATPARDHVHIIYLNSVILTPAQLTYLINIKIHFFKNYIYLFRERGRRETSLFGCLLRGPYWEPGLQPRYVPWLGIGPVTLWFAAHVQYTELHQPGQNSLFLKILFLFTFFTERWREEININIWRIHQSFASHTSATGDLACSPGMCPY